VKTDAAILRTAALLCLAALPLSPLLAQDAGSPGQRDQLRQKMQEHMKKMDRDGNGAISKTEFLAHAEERFNKMDSDGDGQITKEEQAARRERFKEMRAGNEPGRSRFP